MQQICSDEELRHTRCDRATCFDTSTPQHLEIERQAVTFQGN